MRAEDVRTFEELKNRHTGERALQLQPLTAAAVAKLRPVVLKAHAAYQESHGERTGDELVDALVYLAGQRSGGGSHKPFAKALDEILVEVQEVGL